MNLGIKGGPVEETLCIILVTQKLRRTVLKKKVNEKGQEKKIEILLYVENYT